jgi:hypothetical protein
MSSLKADFDELHERIRHGRELGHASFEPIYYLGRRNLRYLRQSQVGA